MSLFKNLFGRKSNSEQSDKGMDNDSRDSYFSKMNKEEIAGFIRSVDTSINYDSFRKTASSLVLSDEVIKEYCTNWYQERNPYCPNELTRYPEVVDIKKKVSTYCAGLFSEKYNSETKQWTEFEIERQFWVIRKLLINASDPYPDYLWNLVAGNPFDRVYSVCRDYAKSKRSNKVLLELVQAVIKWEEGKLIPKTDELSKLECSLWVNWNRVAKDTINEKATQKREGFEAIRSVLEEHIRIRRAFYCQFGAESPYYLENVD